MNLYEAQEMAKTLMRSILDPTWKFEWNNRKGAFGVCNFSKKTIFLSRHFTQIENADHVRDTILHEIAHAIAGCAAGHGREWREAARRIGLADPTRCSKSSNPEAMAASYRYAIMYEDKIIKGYHRRPTIDLTGRYLNGRPETKGKLRIVQLSA